jgi:phage repressor protein C with HTH and peptisase S24 domain
MVERGLNPDNLTVIEVPNDRMAPTMRQGDLALVDAAPDDCDNLVWAFLENGALDIARLSFLGDDGRIIIRDSADEQPVLVPKEKLATIAPLGRVIWSSGNVI